MENVKVANGEPVNKHPFTFVNNVLHSDDIKRTASFFLTVLIFKTFISSVSLVYNCMLVMHHMILYP